MSRGYFGGASAVWVEGLPWCRHAPRTMGIASMAANILCGAHNAQLGETVDAEAKHFADTLDDIDARSVRLATARVRKWKHRRHRVRLDLLARWFLKTSINIATFEPLPIGEGKIPSRPSQRLVEIAFGLREFEPNQGLHRLVAPIEVPIKMNAEFACRLVTYQQHHVVGSVFTFRGLRFFMYFGLEPLPVDIASALPEVPKAAKVLPIAPIFVRSPGGRRTDTVYFTSFR